MQKRRAPRNFGERGVFAVSFLSNRKLLLAEQP